MQPTSLYVVFPFSLTFSHTLWEKCLSPFPCCLSADCLAATLRLLRCTGVSLVFRPRFLPVLHCKVLWDVIGALLVGVACRPDKEEGESNCRGNRSTIRACVQYNKYIHGWFTRGYNGTHSKYMYCDVMCWLTCSNVIPLLDWEPRRDTRFFRSPAVK